MNISVIILILTVCAAIAAFFATKDDNAQKNRIEKLGEINTSLTTKVEELSKINNSIAKENTQLVQQNIMLSNKANELIGKVDELTVASNNLIKRIDTRTEKQSAENALSGTLSFSSNIPLQDNETLRLHLGSNSFGHYVSEFKKDNPPKLIQFQNDIDVVPFRIIGGKLKVSIKIYDLSGNWIADINNNNWIRNPNNTGYFNYDANGFEIIDNKGYVAFSIDFISRTEISVQGYLVNREGSKILAIGKAGYITLDLPVTYSRLSDVVKELDTKKIFDYSSVHWLGKRN